MFQGTLWLNKQFPLIDDNGLLPAILERLEGTPARLYAKLPRLKTSAVNTPGWSIKKHIGHLSDLEPLWATRLAEITKRVEVLSAADMSNAKTEEASHDLETLEALIAAFEEKRNRLVKAFRCLSEEDQYFAPIHPRLQRPMKAVELAYFIAEHDDHHLASITAIYMANDAAPGEDLLGLG